MTLNRSARTSVCRHSTGTPSARPIRSMAKAAASGPVPSSSRSPAPGTTARIRSLPPAPPDADVMVVGSTTGTRAARRFVHDFGTAAGMSPQRLGDLRLAAQELVVNTLVHSGGQGLLSIWTDAGQVVCQVQDGGRIDDPLVGRRPPAPPEVGHGLFIVHQVCDLVRIHRRSGGTIVRIHLDPT